MLNYRKVQVLDSDAEYGCAKHLKSSTALSSNSVMKNKKNRF